MSDEKEVTYNSIEEIPSDKIDVSYEGVCAILESCKLESDGYRGIEDIFRAVDRGILNTLGKMVTVWTLSNISASTSDTDLSGEKLTEFVNNISQYPKKIRTLFNVTLACKIHFNKRFTTKKFDEKLLKTLLLEEDLESLSYIWFCTYRNMRTEGIGGI